MGHAQSGEGADVSVDWDEESLRLLKRAPADAKASLRAVSEAAFRAFSSGADYATTVAAATVGIRMAKQDAESMRGENQ